eukprot:9064585-Pyramimonas_sp.AAC.1
MAQDGSRTVHNDPETAPYGFSKRPSRRPKKPPRQTPGGLEEATIIDLPYESKPCFVCILTVLGFRQLKTAED